MKSLYSEETAEDYIDAANGRREMNYKHRVHEIGNIERLIENGNEVMELLNDAEILLVDGAGPATAYAIRELIKKIKGEA